MRSDVRLHNVQYEVFIYPNNAPFRRYLPRNLKEFSVVVNGCEGSMGDIKNGIEISFELWEDKTVSKIGAILITPVIFVTEHDFMELYEYIYGNKTTVPLCGKDDLYLKMFEGVASPDALREVLASVKHEKSPFTSIHDIVPYVRQKLGRGLQNTRPVTFDLVDDMGCSIIMKDSKNVDASISVFACKLFGLNNSLMLDNEFMTNKNMGLVNLLNRSIIPTQLAGKNFYSPDVVHKYLDDLSNYIKYFTDLVVRMSNNIENRDITIIDQYSRYIVLDSTFIQENVSQAVTTVMYNDRQFFIVEDESQIPLLKESHVTVNGFVLLGKNLERKYKVALLKSGAGGYDMIQSVHL